jgi:cyclopropane fatty-acyl-phospholipid synthase-like methyltransferase
MKAVCLSVFATFAILSQVTNNIPENDIHAPYVATAYPVVDAMLALAHTKRSDIVYDLGCGDGRILIEAARRYGAHGVGVDIDADRIQEAQANAKRAGVESLVRFEEANVYDVDLRSATVVTLYLLPAINQRLRPKLQRELKPGTRIVSHTFDFGDWKATKSKTVGSDQIFLWKIAH